MKTEYYKLAEIIAKDISGSYLCCVRLPDKEATKFKKMFQPSHTETSDYNMRFAGWLGTWYGNREHDNNFRILALLLMDQIAQDK